MSATGTPDQRQRLREAQVRVREAIEEWHRAVDDIVNPPPELPKGSAYDLSNDAARAAWPSPAPAPGG